MRVLIVGARGQLGSELLRCLRDGRAEIGPIPSAYEQAAVDAVDAATLDITDGDSVREWFSKEEPYDVVFNCAAFTNVDGCETSEDLAFAVNKCGAENLALACASTGAKLVHVSTDYVFAGNEEQPRKETDDVGPVSAYGRTKLAGEQAVIAACERSFIVRTAWLYGYVGKNFVKTMVRLGESNGAISVVADQMGNPTNANDLAYTMLKLGLTDNFGIYHCTNNGTCSWFDFASAIVDAAGIVCEKEPLSSEQYKERFPNSADRPRYSSLDNFKLRETIGDEMRSWEEALKTYMENFERLNDVVVE